MIGIAYTIVHTAIYFLSSAHNGPLLPSAHIQIEKYQIKLDEIVATDLFGRVAEGASLASDADLQAPDSGLDLTLLGVFEAKDPEHSTAIVAERNKPGQLYTVGAAVSGNIMLARVSDDHIVLRRAAAFETLRFPQLRVSVAESPDDNATPAAPGDAVESAESYEPPPHDYHDDLPPPLPSSGEAADGEVTNNG